VKFEFAEEERARDAVKAPIRQICVRKRLAREVSEYFSPDFVWNVLENCRWHARYNGRHVAGKAGERW
jgi:hypothetical protein